MTSVAEPEAKPNSSSRPPGPSSSIAARPSSPPTPSSTTLELAVAERVADALGPAGLRVVDRDVGAQRAHALGLGGAARDADGERAGVARRLQEQAPEAARGRGHEHGVVGLEPRASRMPTAVRPVPIIATAASALRSPGISCSDAAGAIASSA